MTNSKRMCWVRWIGCWIAVLMAVIAVGPVNAVADDVDRVSLERRLLDVSVLISVRVPLATETVMYHASGTLIASDGRAAKVLTCWHTFRGVPVATATITVEHGGRSHAASVSKSDEANDVALLTVPVNYVLPVANLAKQIPSIGDALWSAGRDVSGRLSVQSTKLLAVDRYDLPLNLECDGPVIPKGRSGGGLFDGNGELVGLAQGHRNDSPRTGLYVRLPAVRKLTDAANLPLVEARPARRRRVLSFSARWCQHCQADGSFVKDAVPWLTKAGWSIGPAESSVIQTVDIDERPDVASQLGVETIPALIVVEGDRVVERITYRGRADLAAVLVRHGLAQGHEPKPAVNGPVQPAASVATATAATTVPVMQNHVMNWTSPSGTFREIRARRRR